MRLIIWTSLIVLLVTCNGFLFDQLSDKLRCQGVSLLCLPVCLKLDTHGCVTCDCSHLDPSHPENINSGTGSKDPSKPLDGQGVPGSVQCNSDWLRCQCVPTVNAATGCLQCPCGMQPSPTLPTTAIFTSTAKRPTNPITTAPQTLATGISTSSQATTAMTKPFTSGITSTSPMTQSSQPTSTNTTSTTSRNTFPTITPSTATVSTFSLPTYTTTVSTSLQAFSPNTTSPQRMTSHMTTSFNTNLPSVATVPVNNSATPLQTTTTTTTAPFVCPGVFNCSLVCFAGFALDNSGCPLCKCAPIPTDLP